MTDNGLLADSVNMRSRDTKAMRPGSPPAPRVAPSRWIDGVALMSKDVREATSIASLVAQAADEYLEQLGRGEFPDVADFTRRYPQVVSVLPQVLPTLQLIQGAGTGRTND